MKKILSICLAAAALVGCTNSDVEFDTPNEIGLVAVADNITRNVVDGTTYPTSLNMYVYAWTNDHTSGAPNYINGGEFAHNSNNKWGGGDGTTPNPYYWPNVKTLHFAGLSKSGNVASATKSYDVANDKFTIEDYTPGTATAVGANDLMYFPSTKTGKAEGYGKNTAAVPVTMLHTCSWITFLVQGDDVTGAAGSTYKLTGLTVKGLDNEATVTCTGTTVTWSDNEDVKSYTQAVTLATLGTLTKEPAVNVENNTVYVPANGTTGNLVFIPQVPGTLDVTYTYKSSANVEISETVTNLSLAISNVAADNVWEPGKHYIYTLTIKANEILVAPTVGDWDEDDDQTVTVQ